MFLIAWPKGIEYGGSTALGVKLGDVISHDINQGSEKAAVWFSEQAQSCRIWLRSTKVVVKSCRDVRSDKEFCYTPPRALTVSGARPIVRHHLGSSPIDSFIADVLRRIIVVEGRRRDLSFDLQMVLLATV